MNKMISTTTKKRDEEDENQDNTSDSMENRPAQNPSKNVTSPSFSVEIYMNQKLRPNTWHAPDRLMRLHAEWKEEKQITQKFKNVKALY